MEMYQRRVTLLAVFAGFLLLSKMMIQRQQSLIRMDPTYKRSYNPDKPFIEVQTTCSSVQEWRKRQLAEYCKVHNNNLTAPEFRYWASRSTTTFVVEKQKLMITVIHKCMSTSMKMKILDLVVGKPPAANTSHFGLDQLLRKNGIHSLQSYPVREILEMQESYYKVAFVRHPIQRLFAAYLDKMVLHSVNEFALTRNYIVFMVRGFLNVTRGHKLTFEEFVMYILSEDSNHYDLHWRPMVKLALPCELGLDFVGHMETAVQDFRCLFKDKLNIKDSWVPNANNNNSTAKITSHIRKLPQPLLDRLIDVYENDFRAFGYNIQ